MQRAFIQSMCLAAIFVSLGGLNAMAQDESENKAKKESDMTKWRYQQGDYYVTPNSAFGRFSRMSQEKTSPYWIGVQCVPAGNVPILSNIPNIGRLFKRGGLRVNSTTKGSPAEKAGIKKGDVILTFNEKEMNQVAELTNAITKAKTTECTLQIVREGKVIDVEVTPAKRPKPQTDMTARFRNVGSNFKFRYADDCPKDVEVIMQRKGSNLPIVIVKRGKDQWTIRDGKVDELPADVRAYALRVYNSAHPMAMTVRPIYDKGSYPSGTYGLRTYEWENSKFRPIGSNDVMKTLRDLTRKVESLQKTVDELKNK